MELNRVFSFVVWRTFIPLEMKFRILCISFCQLVERLCAVTITRADLAILHFLIVGFLERCVSLFPDVKLKKKAQIFEILSGNDLPFWATDQNTSL